MIYPPYIEETISAFAGSVLTIPFTNNETVSEQEITQMQIIVYDLFGNQMGYPVQAISYSYSAGVAYFNIDSLGLTPGIYYKVQLAYVDINNTVGYYSTVAITKYTTQPSVVIDGLQGNVINPILSEYIGKYSQNSVSGDPSEKLYSSYMSIYDENNTLVLETASKIHSYSHDDNSYEQGEKISINYAFKEGEIYYIVFHTVSLNGLKTSSPRYMITSENLYSFGYEGSLIAENNYEEGYVDLSLSIDLDRTIVGKFIISRTNTKTNEKIILKKLYIQNEPMETWHYKDFVCESGQEYYYTLQQYNSHGIFAKPLISKPVLTDFEHTYLTDGEKILKIKYNAVVKGFKSTIQEKKVETLGGTYPFIFRNGTINYKEFNISGVLSRMSDDEDYFQVYDNSNETWSGSYYTRDNVAAEKKWKLAVLDWLNNGKPKLFKSATEGNYIVRLLSNSLEPFDKTSRVIHSFNSTAIEIDEINAATLAKYNFIHINEPINSGRYTWLTKQAPTNNSTISITGQEINDIQFIDFCPYDIVYICFRDSRDFIPITIGSTGAYQIKDLDISEIQLRGPYQKGLVTYRDITTFNPFELVTSVIHHAPMVISRYGKGGLVFPYAYREGGCKIYISSVSRIEIELRPVIKVDSIEDIPTTEGLEIYLYNNKYYATRTSEGMTEDIFCFQIGNGDMINLDHHLQTEYNLLNYPSLAYVIPEPNEEILKTLKAGLGLKVNMIFSYRELVYSIEKAGEFDKVKEDYINSPSLVNFEAYVKYLETLEQELKDKGVVK